MKKLLGILAISLILIAMPLSTASHPGLTKLMSRHPRPLTDGSFSGAYAMKNESGYVPLGTFSGTYSGDNWTSSFEGTWTSNDGNMSGTMSGMSWGFLYWGELTVTQTNQTTWFGGMFRVNTTDNSFRSISIILTEQNYTMLYELGNLS